MSLIVPLSIIILVSIRLSLTQVLNELNICSPQTQITVEHAFKFRNKLIAFVKLNSSETVYVIKVNGFEAYETINGLQLNASKSVELWKDWNVNINGSVEDDLKNFEDVFVREDRNVTYVVYLKAGRYYRVQYNKPFTHILHIRDTDIASSDDSLQTAIDAHFKGSVERYLTSMRFPNNWLLKCAYVYKNTKDALNYTVIQFSKRFPDNENEYMISDETLEFDLSENTRIVSAFYITFSIQTNGIEFHFVEILSNGSYRVNRVESTLQTERNVFTMHYDSYSYERNFKQLLHCELMSTLSSTTTTTSLTPSSQTTANNTWLYIIAAIILLLIIAAIIVLIWCCCCRSNRKSKSVENGSQENDQTFKSIAEDDETVRSDTGIDSSDTGKAPQTDSPNTKSGASQQSH